jgi:hypothetical protein
MGMVDLYHQSKKDYEEAHNHWLSCQQDLIEAKELLKKRKKKLETIKHFIRIEWEC